MRLETRVSLILVPVVGLVIFALASVIWVITYDQVRRNEIDRTRLALEIALVEVEQSLSGLSAQVDRIQERAALFSRILRADQQFQKYALSAGFLDFAYDISREIPDFTELLLLDEELNLLLRLSLDTQDKFSGMGGTITPERQLVIDETYQYMRETTSSRVITVAQINDEYESMAMKIYSPHVGENASLSWTGRHFFFVLASKATKLNNGLSEGEFHLASSRISEYEGIDYGVNPKAAFFDDTGSAILVQSTVVDLEKTVSLSDVLTKLGSFSIGLVITSLASIFLLQFIILRILKRQVLSPIETLARKVNTSFETGIIDIQPAEEDNEINALGNRYFNLMSNMERLANIDSLSNLPNRHYFVRILQQALSKEPDESYVLFYLDLDRFKQINDFYGHEQGDRILSQFSVYLGDLVADFLSPSASGQAVLSRLAGDEFAVFIKKMDLVTSAEEFSEQLVQKLDREFSTDSGSIFLGASIGVAYYPEHGKTAEELIIAGDEAMLEAKKMGKNRWQVLNKNIQESNRLVKNTHRAIEESFANDQFYLVFQPIYRVSDCKVVGAEVLLRSLNPVLQEIGTESYVCAAEINGSIQRIDKFVTDAAFAKLAEIRKSIPNFRLAVNISAVELVSSVFTDYLEQTIEKYSLTADACVIEITETALTEFGDKSMETLAKLHQLGFKLSLDDFGTGYNSFAQLSSKHITRLKIDKSFIADINAETQNSKMVDIALDTAKLYGLITVGEGVETREQLDYLKQKGCVLFQGFLKSKPLEWKEFSEYLAKQAVADVLAVRNDTTAV